MTIKRYLFLLFSALILTIAVAQVALLYMFKESIDDEIDKRSRDFADMIVNFAVENLDTNDSTDNKVAIKEDVIFVKKEALPKNLDIVVIEVEQETNDHHIETAYEVPVEVIKEEDKLKLAIKDLPAEAQSLILKLSKKFNRSKARRIKGENRVYEVKIFKPRNSQRHVVKQRLKSQINKFKAHKRYRSETASKNDGIVEHKRAWRSSHSDHRIDLINKMFNVIFFVIIMTTLVALIMVFWLSKKFSKPLQQLSNGFKKLEQGEFGIKVEPTGVQEVKQTIERFNAMSDQLVMLAEAEHKLMQQHHLTELSDVSKGIAHALRNPMHTIGLAIEQLSQGDLPEPIKQKLFDKVQNKISQLDKNIKALLTVTSGEIDRDSNLSILTVINDIVLELKQSHQLEDTALLIDVNVAENLSLTGSEKELRSVLHTVLFNAYEACLEASTSPIELIIDAQQVDDRLHIDVVDNGCGISDKIMSRMFEPHNSSKSEGAGMGLYISKRIVELYYDGKLSINNNIAQGDVTGVTAHLELATKLD